MNFCPSLSVEKLKRSEDGQTTIMMAIMMIMLLGMTGLTLDVGRALFTYKVLQSTTDAAALAGGSTLPSSNATAVATQYSATSGNLNARANLPNVTMPAGYPMVKCLTTLKNQGDDCSAPSNGNAIQVKQQITIPLYFMKVLGINQLTMTATSTAAEKGDNRAPYNVALILDTTGSMGSNDTDPNCNDTRINCEMKAVQVLLQNLSPCNPTLSSCGAATNGNVAQPFDRVALYTFPSLKTTTDVQHEYDCSGKTPAYNNYTDPYIFQDGQKPNESIYTVIPFSSDYKTSPTATTLNPSSNLAKAVHAVSGCNGMQSLNANTYVAGALYQATTDIVNLDNQDSTRKGVIIIITDGDMNAPQSWMPYAGNNGQYASYTYECYIADVFAQYWAQNYGVTYYSVGYGIQSGGCSTDNGYETACSMVQGLATTSDNFYADWSSSGSDTTCQSASHPTANLSTIFKQIANSLSTGRLIPDNTT